MVKHLFGILLVPRFSAPLQPSNREDAATVGRQQIGKFGKLPELLQEKSADRYHFPVFAVEVLQCLSGDNCTQPLASMQKFHFGMGHDCHIPKQVKFDKGDATAIDGQRQAFRSIDIDFRRIRCHNRFYSPEAGNYRRNGWSNHDHPSFDRR